MSDQVTTDEVEVAKRRGTLDAIRDEFADKWLPSLMTQADVDYYANPKRRFLVVDVDWEDQEVWYTTHETLAMASDGAAETILDTENRWEPLFIADLNTGERWGVEVNIELTEYDSSVRGF